MRRITEGLLAASLLLAQEAVTAAGPAQVEANAFAPVAGILQHRCAVPGCHTGPEPRQGLRLDPDQVRLTDPGRLRIVAGDPENSLLYRKLLPPERGGYRGRRMPYGDEPLSDEEIVLVRRWIDAFPPHPPGGVSSHRTPPPSRLFHDSHLANLPTPDPLGAGTLEFRILHRFRSSARAAGGEELYGLDGGAWISLGLAYGFNERLEAEARRTNLQADYEFSLKGLLVRQSRSEQPVSVAGRLSYATARDESVANRARWGAQAIVGRRLGDRLSLMVAPTYVWRTSSEVARDDDGTGALGLGAEWRLAPSQALTAEWVVPGLGVEAPFQSLSLGYSVATARHAFHLLVTNTAGAHTDLYAPGGDLDVSKNHFRIGFNISRTFQALSAAAGRAGR